LGIETATLWLVTQCLNQLVMVNAYVSVVGNVIPPMAVYKPINSSETYGDGFPHGSIFGTTEVSSNGSMI
jgi:hypothetical protein